MQQVLKKYLMKFLVGFNSFVILSFLMVSYSHAEEKSIFESEVKIATFNASLNRLKAGKLIEDLTAGEDQQIKNVAEIIQINAPDILFINEFDYDETGKAYELFQKNFLNISQNGAAPISYPYIYYAPVNTGVPSNLDLDNNGSVGGGGDAWGYGLFPGQYGMVIFSKYPFMKEKIRTFQNFLWKDMPNALLPDDDKTIEKNDWYNELEIRQFKLSSKSHWDVPVKIQDKEIHLLVSHPTPPVFDGKEDRNGKRNHDEIRFWYDYISPNLGHYIYDDKGAKGPLAFDKNTHFIIMGDQNADPYDGASTNAPMLNFLKHPNLNLSIIPQSKGAIEATTLQGKDNFNHKNKSQYDTADFNEPPGNLHVDYVLPSKEINLIDAGVFWPKVSHEHYRLVATPQSSSDHRLVWIKILVKQ